MCVCVCVCVFVFVRACVHAYVFVYSYIVFIATLYKSQCQSVNPFICLIIMHAFS